VVKIQPFISVVSSIMKAVKILLAVCVLLSSTVFAKNSDRVIPPELQARAMKMVGNLIEESFPELIGVSITPRLIQNPAVFLATDIKIPSIITGDREYVLYLNNRLATHPISDLALKGILAHELVHFTDYQNMNPFELAAFYVQYMVSDEYGAGYERATDLQAFERGYAIGIKAFRFWLYEQITPEARILKETNYYTPSEIDNWLLEQEEITLL
jgi:hypothetical protein